MKRKSCTPDSEHVDKRPYVPPDDELKALCELIGNRDSAAEEKRLDAASDEAIRDEDERAKAPPQPKRYRTKFRTEEEMQALLKCNQRSPEWHAARKETLGSSTALAAVCGFGDPYGSNDLQFLVDIGSLVPSTSKANQEAMKRGSDDESLVDVVASTLLGYESTSIGYASDKGLSFKHTSPDAYIKYRPDIHHNLATVNDARTGLAEFKFLRFLGKQECSHLDSHRACMRQRLQIAWRHKISAGYALQVTDEMRIYALQWLRLTEAEAWNDFSVLWVESAKCPAKPAAEFFDATASADAAAARTAPLEIGRFTALRVYYNPDIAAFIEDRCRAHVDAVRFALAYTEDCGGLASDITKPPRISNPFIPGRDPKLRVIPLKAAQFLRWQDGRVTCHIRHYWGARPARVALADWADF